MNARRRSLTQWLRKIINGEQSQAYNLPNCLVSAPNNCFVTTGSGQPILATTVLPWSVKKEVSKGILIGARLSLDTVYSRHHHVRAPNTYSDTNTITPHTFPCYGFDWSQENVFTFQHGTSQITKLYDNVYAVRKVYWLAMFVIIQPYSDI